MTWFRRVIEYISHVLSGPRQSCLEETLSGIFSPPFRYIFETGTAIGCSKPRGMAKEELVSILGANDVEESQDLDFLQGHNVDREYG